MLDGVHERGDLTSKKRLRSLTLTPLQLVRSRFSRRSQASMIGNSPAPEVEARQSDMQYKPQYDDILLNFVPASSSVCKWTHADIYGAAVSSTAVLFRLSCTSCGGPSSIPSGCARPSKSVERREVIPARLRYYDHVREVRHSALVLTPGAPCSAARPGG